MYIGKFIQLIYSYRKEKDQIWKPKENSSKSTCSKNCYPTFDESLIFDKEDFSLERSSQISYALKTGQDKHLLLNKNFVIKSYLLLFILYFMVLIAGTNYPKKGKPLQFSIFLYL